MQGLSSRINKLIRTTGDS